VRIIITIYAGLVVLSAISVQAALLASATAGQTKLAISPPAELAADGCGYGSRRTRWQDQWGRWHWGRCVSKTWGSLPRQQFSH
jgi:hypothetical protein